jgi:uncharacterized protein YggE
MKKTVLIVVILFLTSGQIHAQYYGIRQPIPSDTRPQITVTGESAVYVKPDKVEMRFGITTDNMELVKAKNECTKIHQAAMKVIKELGIPEKDVCTDNLFTEPRWQYPYDLAQRKFLGYFVRNGFVVTLSETDKVEKLLDGLLAAGVNNVIGIEFQTSELKKYREEARELAVKAAKEKADKMAGVLGEKVKSVINLVENPVQSSYYFSSWWGYSDRGSYMSQNTIQNHYDNASANSGDSAGDTVAIGKLAVRANVTITFELEAKE